MVGICLIEMSNVPENHDRTKEYLSKQSVQMQVTKISFFSYLSKNDWLFIRAIKMIDCVFSSSSKSYCSVSSVLNKEVKVHGKTFMFDGLEDTAWYSDQVMDIFLGFSHFIKFKIIINIYLLH